jgi:hypothetical protein
MKNYVFLFGLLMAISTTATLQAQNESEFFENTKAVWYGIDFSNARFIGSHGFTNPSDVKARFFNMWNMIVLNEYKKYDVGETYRKNIVKNDLSIVDERNQRPDPYKMVTNDNSYQLSEADIASMIKEYPTEGQNGALGAVFIVESFNKNTNLGHIWVTFFDPATKEIVFLKKSSQKPGGFGLRNYWARTVYNTLKQHKKEYDKWEKMWRKG